MDRRPFATNAGAASFESSIRCPIPPCINDPTGIFRHNQRTAPHVGPNLPFTDLRIGFEVTMYFA
ncbi:pyrroloquinoline quinone precursor peptide PqqA, partial [Pseudomonas allii]|uniref:pyrroloquinoline quinone precursor peptide PqqA n=1 Tax=Pseudomonas allii TaxID=2740531 RepID=UPI0019628FA6